MAVSIYGTLGPACRDRETLEKMYKAGMTGIRLNLSHMSLTEAQDMLDTARRAAAACDRQTQILIDMQGPELRIGSIPDSGLLLTEDDCIELVSESAGESLHTKAPHTQSRMPLIPAPDILCESVRMGDKLLLDDGQILMSVVSVGFNGRTRTVLCDVKRGGLLLPKKSIAVQGKTFDTPAMTEEDLENIRLAVSCGVTGLMQPFVRSTEDLQAVRRALDACGGQQIRLFAKIENQAGVQNYESFMDYADEIIIARGDLGNAFPLCKLPGLQKRIAATCRGKGKPFMVVTQMLKSMEHSAVPTRAEVSDIYNAVADGAASVMLTAETAVGEYPVEAVKMMVQTVREAEKDLAKQ